MQSCRFLRRVVAKKNANGTRESDGNYHHERRDSRLPSRKVRDHLRARDSEIDAIATSHSRLASAAHAV